MPTPVQKNYTTIRTELTAAPKAWLITGVAGQTIVGLDNFSTGHRSNLNEVMRGRPDAGDRFRFIEGDLRDAAACRSACNGVDYVLHQAALGSVPRSIADPITTNQVNVDGFLNVLAAARDARVRRMVFASSSSVYGDSPELPQIEDRTGRLLSPYAVTKATNEAYAKVFQRTYAMEIIGLRYFNVFGPRQDPEGAYAAVIPRWVRSLLRDEPCTIYGDGRTSRDFCYIENVIQANMRAACGVGAGATGQVYNIACGESTSLRELFYLIRDGVSDYQPSAKDAEPIYADFRSGDIAHSFANIGKARELLGYEPTHALARGLTEALRWYAGVSVA